jgi:hypothetical protein
MNGYQTNAGGGALLAKVTRLAAKAKAAAIPALSKTGIILSDEHSCCQSGAEVVSGAGRSPAAMSSPAHGFLGAEWITLN